MNISKQAMKERDAKLVDYYQNNRVTVGDTAKQFGVAPATVSRALKQYGITSFRKVNTESRCRPVAERLYEKIDQSGGEDACWEWQGFRLPSGYGRFWDGELPNYAHRVAYQLYYGEKPTLHVLHSCDNPSCCNPRHLRQGTVAENMADRSKRGRMAQQRDYEGWHRSLLEASKARHKLPPAKLEEMMKLVEAGEPMKRVAQKFGTTYNTFKRSLRRMEA